MDNNTKEKTNYQILLEKLDDENFARKFREQQLAEAKELIDQILMVTSGGAVVTGTAEEWGNENLFKLFEIFQIRHKNFYIPDFAADLQIHLFHFTTTHDDAFREWSKGWEIEDTVSEKIAEQIQEQRKDK
ncbi:MAG TPA: hypothetical protein VF556_02255 [Pyrinomonadaceae bacterium]|jgi:hypothetical protein